MSHSLLCWVSSFPVGEGIGVKRCRFTTPMVRGARGSTRQFTRGGLHAYRADALMPSPTLRDTQITFVLSFPQVGGAVLGFCLFVCPSALLPIYRSCRCRGRNLAASAPMHVSFQSGA